MSISPQAFSIRLVLTGLVGLVLLLCCSLGTCREQPAASSSNGGGTDTVASELPPVDLESKPLPRIPAGTVLGKKAPEGWSHFIMIAIPTLTREDLKDAPKIAAHYAQMFKFTLLAKTVKKATGYELQTVARGFAMTIRDREIVVESGRTFGGDIGLFGDRILAENEKHIEADLRQIARTPTMSIFDAQAVMRQGNEHVRMVMRHAVLVDPATNQLYTFIWLLSKTRTGYALAEKQVQLIPEGMREPRYLSVKRDKFRLGMPTPEAFALRQTPQGKAIPWTPELKKFAAVKNFTREQVVELEKALLATGQSYARK